MSTIKSKGNKPDNGAKQGEEKSGGTQSVGTQTEIISMNYIPPKILSSFQLESEAYIHILYKPHMVFLLAVLCAIIGFVAYSYPVPPGEGSFIANSRVYYLFHILA